MSVLVKTVFPEDWPSEQGMLQEVPQPHTHGRAAIGEILIGTDCW